MVHVNPPTTTKVVLDESWWSLGIIKVIWKQLHKVGIPNFRFWQLFRGGRSFGRNLRSRAQLRAKEGRRIRLEDCFFKTRNHEKSLRMTRLLRMTRAVTHRKTRCRVILNAFVRPGRVQKHHLGCTVFILGISIFHDFGF